VINIEGAAEATRTFFSLPERERKEVWAARVSGARDRAKPKDVTLHCALPIAGRLGEDRNTQSSCSMMTPNGE
jgi:hypothetical protein